MLFLYSKMGSFNILILVGTLNVWTRIGNALDKNVWSRQGNFDNFWRYGHVTIKSEFSFQMVFEGIFCFVSLFIGLVRFSNSMCT